MTVAAKFAVGARRVTPNMYQHNVAITTAAPTIRIRLRPSFVTGYCHGRDAEQPDENGRAEPRPAQDLEALGCCDHEHDRHERQHGGRPGEEDQQDGDADCQSGGCGDDGVALGRLGNCLGGRARRGARHAGGRRHADRCRRLVVPSPTGKGDPGAMRRTSWPSGPRRRGPGHLLVVVRLVVVLLTACGRFREAAGNVLKRDPRRRPGHRPRPQVPAQMSLHREVEAEGIRLVNPEPMIVDGRSLVDDLGERDVVVVPVRFDFRARPVPGRRASGRRRDGRAGLGELLGSEGPANPAGLAAPAAATRRSRRSAASKSAKTSSSSASSAVPNEVRPGRSTCSAESASPAGDGDTRPAATPASTPSIRASVQRPLVSGVSSGRATVLDPVLPARLLVGGRDRADLRRIDDVRLGTFVSIFQNVDSLTPHPK